MNFDLSYSSKWIRLWRIVMFLDVVYLSLENILAYTTILCIWHHSFLSIDNLLRITCIYSLTEYWGQKFILLKLFNEKIFFPDLNPIFSQTIMLLSGMKRFADLEYVRLCFNVLDFILKLDFVSIYIYFCLELCIRIEQFIYDSQCFYALDIYICIHV